MIVNPAAAPISKEQLADLYLARRQRLPDRPSRGLHDLHRVLQERTGRESSQVKAIWSRILFTGRGVPPKQLPRTRRPSRKPWRPTRRRWVTLKGARLMLP